MFRVSFERLCREQAAYFATLDPLLPTPLFDRAGQLLTALGPLGTPAAGVLTYDSYGPGALPSLWSAREVWTMYPALTSPVDDGLDGLLRTWHAVLRDTGPGADTACLLSRPSRDAAATQALLAAGFQPLSVLAVRPGPVPWRELVAPVRVRRAEPADLSAVLALSMLELRYSAQVGAAVLRQDAEAMKRTALHYRLGTGAPMWVAERDGHCVGMIECAVTDVDGASDAYLRPGRWIYLNCLSVSPQAQGTGVGGALVAAAERELPATDGWYLYYNPPNPLSSVFWPRNGYRPLWTLWELRPAGALRDAPAARLT